MAQCEQGCCQQGGCKTGKTQPLCPLCGQVGEAVSHHTLRNLIKTPLNEQVVDEDYYLCWNQECQAVYFHRDLGQIFGQDALTVKVWWKDPGPEVPLCYCQGVTRGQLQAAWAAGARTFAEIVKATGAMGGRRCVYENPAGRCCSSAIKSFLESLNSAG